METIRKIIELRKKKENLELDAGADKAKKQHDSGKMTARERLEKLFDSNTFVEIDPFVETRAIDFDMQNKKVPGDGVVVGYGNIGGRLIFVSSQDYMVIGGSLGEAHARKITKVMDMAIKMGVPFISINDSGGARIEEGLDSLCGYGEIFFRNTCASGVIPQISVIMGPCAGGAVYSPAITDFIFMVENTSYMFTTGPQVIKAVTGEEVTFETLGGAPVHTARSGVAHFSSPNDKVCIEEIRRLIGFLPDNNLSEAPIVASADDPNRLSEELNGIIPDSAKKPYDIKDVIEKIVDNGDFLEIQKHFAQNIVISFGRINGSTVGIIANQPKVMAGALDVNSADKGARFIRFCDAFNIPVITFTDTAGYMPGIGQEYSGIIRHGAKLLYAFSEATVPKINIIVRKAYGGAYIAMNSKHLGADIVFAWPTAEIAVMGPDGAANIIFRKEISEAEDPAAVRNQKIEEYRNKFSNPYVAAARGYVDDVIEPSTTRIRIVNALAMLASKRENRPAKKHGNIPL